jgi:hypothetical protein
MYNPTLPKLRHLEYNTLVDLFVQCPIIDRSEYTIQLNLLNKQELLELRNNLFESINILPKSRNKTVLIKRYKKIEDFCHQDTQIKMIRYF